MRFRSRCILSIFLSSLFQPLITGVGFAQSVAEEQEEQTLQKVDAVETFVDKIADVVEVKVKNEELLERFEQKKEEMEELLEETKEEIEASGVSDSQESKDIIKELKKTVYLKTYSGLTDHDGIDDIVQVEGGVVEQEQAQETAIESMQGEDSGGHPSYTVMLKSSFSQEQIEKKLSPFIEEEKQLQIEQLFEDDGVVFFELKVDQESLLGEELLGDVEEGDIPDHLLGIEVIKPEILEIGQVMVAGLDGEKNDNLRGMNIYESSAYQGGLHEKPKVSVAVIDTGIDYNHPDLKGNISKRIKGHDFVNKDADPMDDHMHGTHVAGTIAASLDGKGVYGVNTNAELVALKICSKNGHCPSYVITRAVKYAADKGVDVLNMSLGGRGTVKGNAICKAITYAVNKGSIVIAAAGNANRPVSQYIPGACPDAITVGAVDKNYKRARFSNYGPGVDLSAPGVGILSTVPNNKYKSLDGTSMATPHVSGLASAVLAYNPTLQQAQMRTLLQQATRQVVYENGKQIGGFVELTKVMDNLGTQQYSHTYKIPGKKIVTQPAKNEEKITVQGYEDEGMQVSTKKITLKVGQTKIVSIKDSRGKVRVHRRRVGKSNIMIGKTYTKGLKHYTNNQSSLAIASVDGEETDSLDSPDGENDSDNEIDFTESETNEQENQDDYLENKESNYVSEGEDSSGIIEESLGDVEEIQLIEEDDEIEIASAQALKLQIVGVSPGESVVYVEDGSAKKIPIHVTVTEKVVTVRQGDKLKINSPEWMRPVTQTWYGFGKKTTPGAGQRLPHVSVDLLKKRDKSSRRYKATDTYVVTPLLLGKHTVELPYKEVFDDKWGKITITLNVISPRKDTQSKKQQADSSFWMSHDYAKLNVGQQVTISLDGEGPFDVKRKKGGIVAYAGIDGGGSAMKIASASDGTEEVEGTREEESMGLDTSLVGTMSLEEINTSGSGAIDILPGGDAGSGFVHYLDPETGLQMSVPIDTLGSLDENDESTENEGGVEIASAGSQSFTLVGLKAGDEMIYVTDTSTKTTKGVFVQVQETRIHIPVKWTSYTDGSIGRSYYGYGMQSFILPTFDRGEFNGVHFENWRDNGLLTIESTYGTERSNRNELVGYSLIPRGFSASRYGSHRWKYAYDDIISQSSRSPKLVEPQGGSSKYNRSIPFNVSIRNAVEAPMNTNYYPHRKVYNSLEYILDVGKKIAPKKTKALSTYSDSFFDVPDLSIQKVIKIKVGETKTMQVGRNGGSIGYSKSNDKIGRISSQNQDVKIASAQDSAQEGSQAQEGTIEITETDEEDQLEVPIELLEDEEMSNEMLEELGTRGEESENEGSDLTYNEVEQDEDEQVEIASVYGKTVSFVGLRPGKSTITVKYPQGRKKKYTVIVEPTVIKKGYNDLLTLTSTHNLAIKGIWVKSKKKLSFNKRPAPKKRWKKNQRVRKIHASSFPGDDVLYAKVYNRKEKRDMYLQLNTSVSIPKLNVSKKKLTMTVGQTAMLKASGGAGKIFVTKSNLKLGFLTKRRKNISVASAGETDEEVAEDEILVESFSGSDDKELESFVDSELEEPLTQEQLDEGPDDEVEDVPGSGDVDWASEELVEDEQIEIASAVKRRSSIPLQALRPGKTNVVFRDEQGQRNSIQVNVNEKVLTKERGEEIRIKSAFQMPVKYVKTKSGTKVKLNRKPKKRWKGGYRKIDTNNFKDTEILYLRLYNRKEAKAQRMQLTIKTKKTNLKLSGTTTTVLPGATKRITITGGLPPYAITRVGEGAIHISHQIGETEENDDLNILGLKEGTTMFTVTDARGDQKIVEAITQPYNITTQQNGGTFSVRSTPGFYVSSVSTVNGSTFEKNVLGTTHWKITPSTSDTFIIYYHSAVSGRTYAVEKIVSHTEVAKEDMTEKNKKDILTVGVGEVISLTVPGAFLGGGADTTNATFVGGSKGLKIASAGESEEDIDLSDFELPEENLLDEDGNPIVFPALTQEQRDIISGLQSSEQDFYGEIQEEEENIEIAGAGERVYIQGLKPGLTTFRIVVRGQSAPIYKTVQTLAKTYTKPAGEEFTFVSDSELLIYQIFGKGVKATVTQKPNNWEYGGVWKVSTSGLKTGSQIRFAVYNTLLEKSMEMWVNVKIGPKKVVVEKVEEEKEVICSNGYVKEGEKCVVKKKEKEESSDEENITAQMRYFELSSLGLTIVVAERNNKPNVSGVEFDSGQKIKMTKVSGKVTYVIFGVNKGNRKAYYEEGNRTRYLSKGTEIASMKSDGLDVAYSTNISDLRCEYANHNVYYVRPENARCAVPTDGDKSWVCAAGYEKVGKTCFKKGVNHGVIASLLDSQLEKYKSDLTGSSEEELMKDVNYLLSLRGLIGKSENYHKRYLVDYFLNIISEKVTPPKDQSGGKKSIKEVTPTVLKKNLEHRFFFSKANNFKVYYNKSQLALSDQGKQVMRTGIGSSPEGCGSDISESIGAITQIPIKLLVGDAYVCIENIDTKEIQRIHIISESSNSSGICVNNATNQCLNVPLGHVYYQQALANEGFANGSITPYSPTVGESVKQFFHGGKMYRVRVISSYKEDVMYVLDEIGEGVVKGDYIENPNGLNIVGQIGGGFTPAGVVADGRDLRYQWNNGSNFDIGMSVVGFVPGIGDGAKAATKGTKIGKSGDELGVIIKALPYIYMDIGSSVGIKIYKKTIGDILDINGVKESLERIRLGKNKFVGHDGKIYENSTNLLPIKENGTYKEYTVETPGIIGRRGEERLVIGIDGDTYYTDDHYKSFIRIK